MIIGHHQLQQQVADLSAAATLPHALLIHGEKGIRLGLNNIYKGMKFTKPLFITFEGGEGTGKTTQVQTFANWLEKSTDICLTREVNTPGIRKVLWEVDVDYWTSIEEAFLLVADRSKHAREVVTPALEAGKTVISDRYYDSSYVYQCHVRGVEQSVMDDLHQKIKVREPDITIILDIDVRTGLARKEQQATEGLTETRFEEMGGPFHEKVREGFSHIAKENPSRCIVVPALGNIPEVQTKIQQAFLAKAKEKGLLC